MRRKKRKYVRKSTGSCRMGCKRPGYGERVLCDPCRSSMCSISLNKNEEWMETRIGNLILYQTRVVAVLGREVEFQHIKETARDKDKRRGRRYAQARSSGSSARNTRSRSSQSSSRKRGEGSSETSAGKTVH